ncbi:MAG: DNA-3-methyladenine glycosylase family protein [Trebonia sp.]
MRFSMTPDGPFSLAAAAGFGFGPNPGRPNSGKPGPAENEMRLAFVTDDMSHHAGVYVTQDPDGTVSADIETDGDPAAAWWQVLRILSLDGPAGEWPEVGARDAVMARLQDEHRGLRPVLFHSPYEAAAWSIISARRYRGQAVVVRNRLAAELGRTFTIAGEQVHAFPLPHRLVKAESLRSVAPQRVEWLHAVARAALDGALDPGTLSGMDPADALAHLQGLPGIGPSYGTLILIRATGVRDVLTFGEPRLAGYVAHFYGAGPSPVSRPDLERVAENWRPFRTWAAVLLRVAGDRLGLPAAA